MRALSILSIVAAFAILITAQTPGRPVVSKPNVTLSKEAYSFGGIVRVEVTVDASGKVIAVGKAIGPGSICPSVTRPDVVALREDARKAAARVKFEPSPGSSPLETSLEFEFIAKESPAVDEPGETKKFIVYGSTDPAGGAGTEGGILNGRAEELPKPAYPAAARAVKAAGAISVQVLIEEDGTMFSAQAISGHPLLRTAARTAACSARFSPTLLDGSPVKVSGVITYNFVP